MLRRKAKTKRRREETFSTWLVQLLCSVSRRTLQLTLFTSLVLVQFKFAGALDWLLMLVGLLAAIAHGAVLPASMLVFGRMINLFVFHSISANITATVNGTLLNELPANCPLVNLTIREIRNVSGETLGTFGSDSFVCTTSEDLFNGLNIYVAAFVGLAVGSMLLGFFQVSTFSLAAMRQTHRIRKMFYRSILRQNVAWFDENKAGELNSRLVE